VCGWRYGVLLMLLPVFDDFNGMCFGLSASGLPGVGLLRRCLSACCLFSGTFF